MNAFQRAVLILVFLQWLDLPLFSQKDSLHEPFIAANALSGLLGFTGNEFNGHNLEDVRRVAPGNSVAQMDQSGAIQQRTRGGSGNVRLHAQLNIHFKTKDFKTSIGRFSSEWRVGLAIGISIPENMMYKEKIYLPEDTFSSNHTNMVVYEGGATNRYYQYKIWGSQTYIDVSKTYHTNQLKRVGFYTGINAGIGFSFDNFVQATWADDNSQVKGTPYRALSRSGNYEKTYFKNEVFYNLNLPVGVVFRFVSTKSKLAKKFAFTAESRFGYRFEKNSYTNTYVPVFIGGLQLGIKLYFHKQQTG